MSPAPMVSTPAAVYILVTLAVLLLGWSLLRHTKAGPEKPELPRRRVPIDDDTREHRTARLDAVLAQANAHPVYLRDRLAPFEPELSELLELALELDDAEDDHAQPHP